MRMTAHAAEALLGIGLKRRVDEVKGLCAMRANRPLVSNGRVLGADELIEIPHGTGEQPLVVAVNFTSRGRYSSHA